MIDRTLQLIILGEAQWRKVRGSSHFVSSQRLGEYDEGPVSIGDEDKRSHPAWLSEQGTDGNVDA